MDFSFTDEQVLLRDTVRQLLDKACPPAAVRAAWDPATPGYDAALFAQFDDMGLFDPSLTDLDLVLVFEETGRAAVPGPVVEASVARRALAESGVDAGPGDGLVTYGQEWAAEAGTVVTERDGALHAVAKDDVTVAERLAPVDHSRRRTRIEWTKGTRLDGASPETAFDRGALATAAQLVGLADRMIAMTVTYVKERQQFGVVVGSYQAIKHHLANALLKTEYARPPVYRAAYSLTNSEPDRARDVSFAKVYAARAALLAGRVALQCHGAIGYSFEYDLHLFMKRAWVLEAQWGDTAFHQRRVAAAVLDG